MLWVLTPGRLDLMKYVVYKDFNTIDMNIGAEKTRMKWHKKAEPNGVAVTVLTFGVNTQSRKHGDEVESYVTNPHL